MLQMTLKGVVSGIFSCPGPYLNPGASMGVQSGERLRPAPKDSQHFKAYNKGNVRKGSRMACREEEASQEVISRRKQKSVLKATQRSN